MAYFPIPYQRSVLVAGLALAAFAGPVAVMVTPVAQTPTSLADCTGGEEEDVYTTSCVPFMVPNSPEGFPEGFSTTAANPDIPEIQGIPCTGRDAGACIGLAEEQQSEGPQPVPRSTIEASP